MPGTRTAPTVDGTPDRTILSIRYIDATGDKRSDSYKLLSTATDAQVEDLIAKLQIMSNASIYEVKVAASYSSVPLLASANADVKENVGDNAVIQYQHATLETFRGYVPALIDNAFVAGSNNIDPTYAGMADVINAFDLVVDAGYTAIGIRFNERRQLNKQAPV